MAKDNFTKQWITNESIEIVKNYEPGVLTLRGLHYQLVARGMTNSINHYKRVVNAMKDARWNGTISFYTFSDHDREVIGSTASEEISLDEQIKMASEQISSWMNYYSLNRWENQLYYPEVWIEKKALQGVFKKVCRENDIALAPCKGYPSLTFLNEAADRFLEAEEDFKTPIILYFGDYDPSGEDIPRSIKENLGEFGVDLEVKRILLMEDQVVEMNLPPAPAKSTDTRSKEWNGIGQVELDAVDPMTIQNVCQSAIDEIFDQEAYAELMIRERAEREEYKKELALIVKNL